MPRVERDQRAREARLRYEQMERQLVPPVAAAVSWVKRVLCLFRLRQPRRPDWFNHTRHRTTCGRSAIGSPPGRVRRPLVAARTGGLMTLGTLVAEDLRLSVHCLGCGHLVAAEPAEPAKHFGTDTLVAAWFGHLVCSECGSQVDLIVFSPADRYPSGPG